MTDKRKEQLKEAQQRQRDKKKAEYSENNKLLKEILKILKGGGNE